MATECSPLATFATPLLSLNSKIEVADVASIFLAKGINIGRRAYFPIQKVMHADYQKLKAFLKKSQENINPTSNWVIRLKAFLGTTILPVHILHSITYFFQVCN